MPGMRDKNLRSGDLHEELGIFLLKAVALVAAVPRQEDAGTDAFATLIRPEGNRRLIPEVSFLVQLKSPSVEVVTYKSKDELAWISALDSPLFIGRVDIKRSRIELFTTLRLQQTLLNSGDNSIELWLDQPAELSPAPNLRQVHLGPPVHAWSMSDLTEPDFQARSYAVLRPHVAVLRRNLVLRGIQTQKMLQWETGQPPTDGGEMWLLSPKNDVADTLRDMAPHVRRLLLELQVRKRYADFSVILAFIDLMRRWGADPDPDGGARLMTGLLAGGPEISVEDAIRIRQAYRLRDMLDLHSIPVHDEALAVIDGTVTQLALVDSPVTDAGIPQLLKLTSLKRLNLTGTRITDDGLFELGNLPNLEWVCANRTSVTVEGAERLMKAHSSVTVVVGTGP